VFLNLGGSRSIGDGRDVDLLTRFWYEVLELSADRAACKSVDGLLN
jgi:hypothetical protein